MFATCRCFSHTAFHRPARECVSRSFSLGPLDEVGCRCCKQSPTTRRMFAQCLAPSKCPPIVCLFVSSVCRPAVERRHCRVGQSVGNHCPVGVIVQCWAAFCAQFTCQLTHLWRRLCLTSSAFTLLHRPPAQQRAICYSFALRSSTGYYLSLN